MWELATVAWNAKRESVLEFEKRSTEDQEWLIAFWRTMQIIEAIKLREGHDRLT